MATDPSVIHLEHRFQATACELKSTREKVREAMNRLRCSVEEVDDVVLAIDEACQNIIRHAYGGEAGEIELRLEYDDGVLSVSLRDRAPTSDPRCLERSRSLDDVKPGGLGTHLMKSVMDEVRFEPLPAGEGNLLHMRKHLGGGDG